LKPRGIYRKLDAMAPTLLGIVVALAMGHAWSGPVLPVPSIELLVTRAVNDDAAALSAARGFKTGRPLIVRVLDRPHMRAERDAALRAVRSPGAADAEARLLAALGVGPKPSTQGATGPDVTGFYDPATKRIYVGNWVSFAEGRAARLKDVAEAMLDRRFPVVERNRRGREPARDADADGDALWARMALLEGDATVQTMERLSPDGALPPTPALTDELEDVRRTIAAEDRVSPPLALARRLFVALDGTSFVAGVRARAPWSAVNQLWERLPASSEQILHPEKYQRREAPDDVAARLPKRPATADEIVYSDTLGELGARVFLQRAAGDYKAERAASGWGGDRARLQRAPGTAPDDVASEYVVWVTTWDEISDAQDFVEQATAALGALAGAPLVDATPRRRGRPAPRDTARWRATDARGRVFALDWQGRAVTLLLAGPSSAESTLTPLTTAAARRGRR